MNIETNKSTNERLLHGKRAVVTGAGSGIGRAIAEILAASGANLLIQTRGNQEGLETTRQNAQEQGIQVETVMADFASMNDDPASYSQFVEAAERRLEGSIDVWINAAGADILTGERSKWPMARKLEMLWAVDVRPTVMLSREAGRRMTEQDVDGAIVNIGWDGAARGMAGDSAEAFAVAKGAIASFSRSLACSLAPHVRVNCLAPGWIKTAWGESADEQWQVRASRESLLHRWGTPEEIARVVRFLVSPDGSFVNGQVIDVNGGFRPSVDD